MILRIQFGDYVLTIDGPVVSPQSVETTVPLGHLGLSRRARNVLRRWGATTLDDVLKRTRQDILDSKNAGRVTADEIENKLAAHGLHLHRI